MIPPVSRQGGPVGGHAGGIPCVLKGRLLSGARGLKVWRARPRSRPELLSAPPCRHLRGRARRACGRSHSRSGHNRSRVTGWITPTGCGVTPKMVKTFSISSLFFFQLKFFIVESLRFVSFPPIDLCPAAPAPQHIPSPPYSPCPWVVLICLHTAPGIS